MAAAGGSDMQRGAFITLEGIEGAGKSTQLGALRDFLQARNIVVQCTREPGGTPLGERLRSILLDPATGSITPEAELLLIFSARAEHLARVVKPALASGNWVVCDRFTDASYAYQGGGRGLGSERVAVLETWLQGDLRPDLTILLDLPAEMGLSRSADRGQLDRMEQEQIEFFARVRRAYLEQSERAPSRYLVIDARQSVAEVSAAIASGVQRWLKAQGVELSGTGPHMAVYTPFSPAGSSDP
jgi:dTMP kinase